MITGKTRVYAVIGDPVAHSLSPPMHNAWMAQAGLDAVYVALQSSSPDFAALAASGLAGVNVTVPHKERAAASAERVDPMAHRLRAANVLRFGPDGAEAFNTDAPGFIASLAEAYPTWRDEVRTALVLGAGGAARAIAFGLADAGVARIRIANRTPARAASACEGLANAETRDWAALDAAFAEADLIVNATTLGLAGAPSPDWPVAATQAHAIVADAVYRPLETPLLAASRKHGLRTVDGLGMLIHQGALAFEIWFGQRPDVQAARRQLQAVLAP